MKVPVLLENIFNHPLTYHSDEKNLKAGDFVEVPFGKNRAIGVVWDKLHETKKNIKIRTIQKKIDKFKISNKLIKFINIFSIYNIAPKGLVLKMTLGGKKNFTSIIEDIKRNEIKKKKIFILNEDQKKALEFLKKNGNNFNVSVLQGVTGSGKTIVYFERIKEIIKNNKQVLLLLPEIFLTNQFNQRFRDYFGYFPHMWHSKISLKEKRKVWQGLIDNKIKVLIGARSSLLLPFKDLGIIIVDEEHDQSYKQEEGIIYNARDMAIMRASIENIPVNLVTSIPSIETFNNIKNKKYNYVALKNRYKNFPLPKIEVVQLQTSELNKRIISSKAEKIVSEYLKKKEQILFFLNRRGFSPFLVCKNCGYKHSCPNCSIYLNYHKIKNKLICHQCGLEKKTMKLCKEKDKDCDFIMCGFGVEKVYEELSKKYPNKKIKIFSSDYLSKKKRSEQIINEIENNKIDILVGTQMISKGFNFPKLNCIVVVDADFSRYGYDLRSTEKNLQMYHQLSGRAGRFSSKSTIIFQTLSPTHSTLKDLMDKHPEKFLLKELKVRQENNLPPYKKLIAIIVSSNSKLDSFRGALELKKILLENKKLEVMGPVESPILKIRNKFRTRLLLRSNNEIMTQLNVTRTLNNLRISNKIKLTVDVDPYNFY